MSRASAPWTLIPLVRWIPSRVEETLISTRSPSLTVRFPSLIQEILILRQSLRSYSPNRQRSVSFAILTDSSGNGFPAVNRRSLNLGMASKISAKLSFSSIIRFLSCILTVCRPYLAERNVKTLFLLLNRDQLDLKNQSGIRADFSSRTAFPISERRRDENLPFRSLLHQLQGFRPSRNHPVHRKTHRLPAAVGAVKFCPIDRGTPIMDCYGVGRFRFIAGPGFDHLILQSARQGYDTLLLLIFGEKGLSLLLCSFRRVF